MKKRKQALKQKVKEIIKELKDTQKFIGGKIYNASVIVDNIIGKIEPKSTKELELAKAGGGYITSPTKFDFDFMEAVS